MTYFRHLHHSVWSAHRLTPIKHDLLQITGHAAEWNHAWVTVATVAPTALHIGLHCSTQSQSCNKDQLVFIAIQTFHHIQQSLYIKQTFVWWPFLDQDLVLLLLLVLVGAASFRSLKLRRFKSDLGDIWQEFSSRKCASTDGVGFSIWRQNFRRWPWCHFTQKSAADWRVNRNRLSARAPTHSVCQFLIYSKMA